MSETSQPPSDSSPKTNEGKGLKRTKQQKKQNSQSSPEGKSGLTKTKSGGLTSLNSFYFPGKKPFDDWQKSQLVTVLVNDGQVIRDENYLSHSILKTFAEAVFLDRPIPPKPMPLSLEEQTARHNAALVIQNAYFTWMVSFLEGGGEMAPQSQAPMMHDVIVAAMQSGAVPRDVDGVGDLAASGAGSNSGSFRRDEFSQNKAMSRSASLQEREEQDLHRQVEDEEEGDAGVQNSILEEEFIPPSVEYASLYADYNHPRRGGLGGKVMPWMDTSTGRHCLSGGWGEQCDMFEERQVSELGRYGPGITNYFKFLKWAFWIFVFLSFMWLPVMVLNSFGTGEHQSAQLNDLAQTMVGNLGDTNNTKTLHVPGCTGSIRGQDCQLDKEVVAQYYAFTDLIATIVVILGYMWLRYFEVKEAKLLDKNSLSVANYTISVKGFDPSKEVTEKDLKKHFKNVTGQDVAAVTIAYDNEKEINLYKKRGELMMGRLRCTRQYQYYRSKQRAGLGAVSQDKLFEILSKRVEITSNIRDIDRQTAKCESTTDKPLYAFITFENAIAARLAVRAYNKSMWGYLRMKRSLMYNKARLSVAAASEPSTIIWENLKYYKFQRGKRRVVSTFITLILLGISAVANIIARGLEQNAASTGGDEFCPEEFFDLSKEQQQDAVENNDDLLHCYCDQYMLSEQSGDSLCSSYARQNLISDLFVYLAAFVVLCTNGAISLFLSRISAHYEKHHSQDSMEKSIFHRMFVLKLLNMGLLFLTMNFWVEYLDQMGIEYESTQNFSTQWYKTIGVSMVLVQGGNIFGPHMYKFFFYRRARKRREAAVADPINGGLTQIDLNKLFLGPDFLVAHRYAQILADFFICIIFSAGMPILTFIAIFNFYTTYWVDKFLFLNYYRSPPRYKTNIGRSATALIPYAIVLHLVASIWMLGNKEIFHAKSEEVPVGSFIESWNLLNIHEKVTQKHTYPLFVLLVVVLVGLLLAQIAEQIFTCVSSMIKTCCGSCMAKSEFYQEMEQYLFNTITIPYGRAVRRGIIKGLTNYNILQNPKYKEAFAISDVFSMHHSRVKSLRHFEKLSFDDDAHTSNPESNTHIPLSTDDGTVATSGSKSRGGKAKRRGSGTAGTMNPDTIRLMNASMEASRGQGGVDVDEGIIGYDEKGGENEDRLSVLQRQQQQQQQQQLRSPSPQPQSMDHSHRSTYGHLPTADDDMSVQSGATTVTRVTGVLLTGDDYVSDRPTSAIVDMGSTFRGGSMTNQRPSTVHGNPMLESEAQRKDRKEDRKGGEKKKRRAAKKEGNESVGGVGGRAQAKLTPSDQKHIEEFKGGKVKSKGKSKAKKGSDFMNNGAM